MFLTTGISVDNSKLGTNHLTCSGGYGFLFRSEFLFVWKDPMENVYFLTAFTSWTEHIFSGPKPVRHLTFYDPFLVLPMNPNYMLHVHVFCSLLKPQSNDWFNLMFLTTGISVDNRKLGTNLWEITGQRWNPLTYLSERILWKMSISSLRSHLELNIYFLVPNPWDI
jgi:hypothetical protein